MAVLDWFPPDFSPQFEVVLCLIECEGHILLLKRHNMKSFPLHWCIPGGKRRPDETILDAVIRETREETGIVLTEGHVNFVYTVAVRQEASDGCFVDIVEHLFRYQVEKMPDHILLSKHEHTGFMWVRPMDTLAYELIPEDMIHLSRAYALYVTDAS